MERILIEATDAATCEIVVGRYGGAPSPEDILPPAPGRRRVAILTHDGATRIAGRLEGLLEDAGLGVAVRQLPDRDGAKTLATAEAVYLWLNGLGITRSDSIVAVGGGALTDAAGFIAATYLRGIEMILLPTTLLGAVDAAVGGKTAVNVGGKNLAGIFRHPARVVVDLDVLDALPAPLLVEGAAEALKAGLIADPELVARYEAHGIDAPLDDVVARAIRVKAAVVGDDFREQGRRAVLNYGHTVGHAIETAAGLAHGHAVAIGMEAAAAASERLLGFPARRRQTAVIERLGLPTMAPDGLDRATVLRYLALDKKRDDTGMRMVLLRDIGDAAVVTVDAATVGFALDAVGIE